MKYLSERRFQMKARVDEIKSSKPCSDCGNFFPAVCMDFDHLGNKFKNISNMLQKYSWKRILEEIAKCDLVCSNCHRIRTESRSVLGKLVKPLVSETGVSTFDS